MKRKIAASVTACLAVLVLGASTVFAHHIQAGPTVSCTNGTVSVTVSGWTGGVIVTNVTTHKTTTLQPSSQNATVVFTLSSIGGNGSYTVGRVGTTTDPVPVAFTVACSTPTPTPSPTPKPTPTPTPHPTPTPTPHSTPTPTPPSIPTPPGVPVPSTGGAS